MTTPQEDDELNELVDELRMIAGPLVGTDNERDAHKIMDAAARLTAMREEIERKDEALDAIIARAPERDAKWAGMTARDIAIAVTTDHNQRPHAASA